MKFFYFTIYNFSIGIFLKSYGYLSFLSFTICELIFILQNKIYNLVSGKLRPVDAKKSEIKTKGKRHKVVRFLISPKKKKVKIEVNKIMNPAFLLGTAFNIAYWHRKYHSGTICKGVSNPQTSKALSGCEKEEIPK